MDYVAPIMVYSMNDNMDEPTYYKQRIEYLEALVRKYKYDALTGLMGKLDCIEMSINLFEEYKFSNETFFFALIDINGLHNINRTNGYHVGDKLIKGVADDLREHFQLHQIYRISGDEFVVMTRGYQYTREEIEEKLNSVGNITYVVDECDNGYITPKQMFKQLDAELSKKKSDEKRI